LTALARDKGIGKHIVPIVPDEARTFGMEGLFRQLGIYASQGQLYDPVDSDEVMYYREDATGQILEEGINEAGSISSFIAAGTAYANYGVYMVPFYAFYSMFGFQRVGDFIWSAADSRARGFLIAATSGRTTLAGEGLQHLDGHSHILSSTVPTCRSYDPTYGYELAVIIQDGMRRMYQEEQERFYYITVTNESYRMPAMPEGAADGIIRGMYLLRPAPKKQKLHVQLLGSGAILREVIAAAELLESEFNVASDVWSVTSFTELARDAQDLRRQQRLRPSAAVEPSYVERALAERPEGPVIAATDYMKLYAEQIRPAIPRRYVVLGTDGFGRSDTREDLRDFFEVSREHIAYSALYALSADGKLDKAAIEAAMKKLKIDPERPNPARI
ncbi:MAG TPA: pyruvate dehydrogenase (acetyl-transferring), homodimeric type, partial [Polyangiales bacterium]|nr:pyruvate dehydrogenase (acetyl-transferring), homodimeric type [Polyangiales bacterium]